MMIADVLREPLVIPALLGTTKEKVLEELAARVVSEHPEVEGERLVEVLWEREKLSSTAIGEGIAIPHARLPRVSQIVGAFGRHPAGIDYQSLDGQPTKLFFLVVAPEDSAGQHLKALARISRLLKEASTRARLMNAGDQSDLYRCLIEADSQH